MTDMENEIVPSDKPLIYQDGGLNVEVRIDANHPGIPDSSN